MELHHHQTSGAVRWRVCAAVLGASAVIALLVTHALTAGSARVGLAGDVHVPVRILTATTGTAREAGASHKASGWQGAASGKDASADRFRWSKAALQWQRTAFHFQPKKNYMNGRCSYSFQDFNSLQIY
jgi:beta-fructofuranosidase